MFNHWYNSSLRNYCVLMGDLFSRVQVARNDDGKIRYIKVPITFASKERFAQKMNSLNSVNGSSVAKVETILPRMSLDLLDIVYNSQQKTNTINRTLGSEGSRGLVSQYNPVPVKMIFELSCHTRNQDDMFQIIEQILPYFQPHFSTVMTELHENDIKFDRNVRVTLQSTAFDNQFDTDNTTRRRLVTDFVFEVNGYIYPPVREIKGEIRTIYVDLFSTSQELSADATFESIDTQVDPLDVEKENWTGEYIQSETKNIQMPSGDQPSGVRRE